MKQLADQYREWLFNQVLDSRHHKYRKLVEILHETDFTYTLPMDGNRFEDGIDLRYRFCWEKGIKDAAVAQSIDDRPCSVLEMMVALSKKCEEQIMYDFEIGDRTGRWFWEMIDSLGLADMDDRHINRAVVHYIIDRFLARQYAPNGNGGLFTFDDGVDVRNEEIWCQMMWHLDNYIKGE